MINDTQSSPREVACRIRAIIGEQDRTTLAVTARRLGVSGAALRAAVDASNPHPALNVIVAVARTYGVDPSWLVTGEYDACTHRALLETDDDVSREDVARLIVGRIPAASEAAMPFDAELRREA